MHQNKALIIFLTLSLIIGGCINLLVYYLPYALTETTDNRMLTSWLKQLTTRRFLIIELLTTISTTIVIHITGINYHCYALLLLTWILLTLAIIDIEYQILPDHFTIPTIWLGLIFNAFQLFIAPKHAILGATLGYISLWSAAYAFKVLRRMPGMGHGDFKLFALLGAWLGWQKLPLILLYASVAGSIGGTIFCYIKYRKINQPFPFGPYLAVAGWCAALFPNILY